MKELILCLALLTATACSRKEAPVASGEVSTGAVEPHELAEWNGDKVFLTSGCGDLAYFPALLLKFMEDNYYPAAESRRAASGAVTAAAANYLSPKRI